MSGLFQGIGPLSQALGFHMDRHNVLASNVAHVETPGYQAKDVKRPTGQNFGNLLSAAMTRTHEGHLQGSPTSGAIQGQVVTSPDGERGLDGNSVSLDIEATKIAENRLRYEVVSAVASAEFRQLMYAANDGR